MTDKNWDEWLENLDELMRSLGYNKYNQKYKNEDFSYWKPHYKGGEKIYQTGSLVYDFRKHGNNDVSIQYECMLIGNDRIDMTVCKDSLSTQDFEVMANDFYNTMSKYE